MRKWSESFSFFLCFPRTARAFSAASTTTNLFFFPRFSFFLYLSTRVDSAGQPDQVISAAAVVVHQFNKFLFCFDFSSVSSVVSSFLHPKGSGKTGQGCKEILRFVGVGQMRVHFFASCLAPTYLTSRSLFFGQMNGQWKQRCAVTSDDDGWWWWRWWLCKKNGTPFAGCRDKQKKSYKLRSTRRSARSRMFFLFL